MTEIKNILLVGRSGRGKSTLANVLTNKINENGQFEEFIQIFKEGELNVSQTRNIQNAEFECQLDSEQEIKKYCIIDTPGIGDTKLPPEEILEIISEAVYLVRDGVSRILFVTDGRFDKHETAAYNLLRSAIFDEEITNHTTIVRTKFSNFENEEEREKDIDKIKENEELKEIIDSCQEEVVYVNNPPVEIAGADDETEAEINKRKRSRSRKILFDHLNKTCQEENYKPKNLEELEKKIHERMKKKRNLVNLLNKLENQLRKTEGKVKDEKLVKRVKSLEEELKEKKDEISSSINATVLEHVQSKISIKELSHLVEVSRDSKSSSSKKNNWKLKAKLFWEELIKKFKFPKSSKEKKQIVTEKEEKNLDEEINEIISELEKENNLGESLKGIKKATVKLEEINILYWKEMHQDFTLELQNKWEEREFSYEEVKEWITIGFQASDSSFASWLRDDKKLTVEKIKELSHVHDINHLRKEYSDQLGKEVEILKTDDNEITKGEEEHTITEVTKVITRVIGESYDYEGDEQPTVTRIISGDPHDLEGIEGEGTTTTTRVITRVIGDDEDEYYRKGLKVPSRHFTKDTDIVEEVVIDEDGTAIIERIISKKDSSGKDLGSNAETTTLHKSIIGPSIYQKTKTNKKEQQQAQIEQPPK